MLIFRSDNSTEEETVCAVEVEYNGIGFLNNRIRPNFAKDKNCIAEHILTLLSYVLQLDSWSKKKNKKLKKK